MNDLFRVEAKRATLQWGMVDAPSASDASLPLAHFAVTALQHDSEPRTTTVSHIPPRLLEETQYPVFISGEGVVEVRHDDPVLLRGLIRGTNGHALAGTINFRSHVGRTRFVVAVDGEPEFAVELEVFPSKLDYADDFTDLVADTQDFLAALALQYLAPTWNFGTTAPSQKATYVEWLSILRNVLADLENGLFQIARQPLRALRRDLRRVRVERIRRADSRVRAALRRSREPRFIDQQAPQVSLDTPEHRWLASQLHRVRERLRSLLRVEAGRPPSDRQRLIVDELHAMERRVAALEALEPMRAATEPPAPGFASLQLIKAPGYREAYFAATRLSLSIRIDSDALRVSVKDIATLYEYWTFLAVIDHLARATGSVEPLFRLIRVYEEGLHVHLRRGETQTVTFSGPNERTISVVYNPRFHTPLLDQKPDIVVQIHDGAWPVATLVLDAKYRLDSTPQYATAHRSPGPPADALNVLHRYRDAILAPVGEASARPSHKRTVVQAAALFPYREPAPAAFEQSDFWRALHQIGVGALPFLPRGKEYVERWLDSVLASSGWALSDQAISHASHDASLEWRRASSESVLVAPLRRPAQAEHLRWIEANHTFYTPETSQPRLLATKWVAFYEHASRKEAGKIRRWAPVEAVEVRRRSDLDTPWAARRDPDERQVVFRLGPMRDGLRIENRRGERVSGNRWSTRLALLRAHELTELLLETEPEWRFYDHLLTVGESVALTPAAVRLQSEDEPRGRAVFHVAGADIRHERGGRFSIATDGARREVTLDDLIARFSRLARKPPH